MLGQYTLANTIYVVSRSRMEGSQLLSCGIVGVTHRYNEATKWAELLGQLDLIHTYSVTSWISGQLPYALE